MPLSAGFCAVEPAISIKEAMHEVRYASGGTVYIEALENGRWLRRDWGFESVPNTDHWDLPSFEMRVKTEPSAGSIPGKELSAWRWVAATEITSHKERHAAVELASTQYPLVLKVHTVLDGTPVLTRWLEITNRSDKAIALTSVFPWAGRLWPEDELVDLGYSMRSECCWEGWFGWKRLTPGTNRIQQEKGLAYDHPYFVLRNEPKDEYFFGQLEWPVNRVMEFYKDHGVSFKIGPTAANALRVIASGETINTPAVHLAHVRGDFDTVVQAMHDHIRPLVSG